MKQISLTLLFGSFLVVLIDALASLVSLHFQINYALFSIVSSFIYAYIGFYCAKYKGLLWSVIGAGIIGLVDSTLGWYVSSMISQSRFQIEMNSTEITTTIVFVLLTAMVFGLIGGLISRWLNR